LLGLALMPVRASCQRQARSSPGQHLSRIRVSKMKILSGLLYFACAVSGLYWSIRLYLMGMYGAPFSWWYPMMSLASLSLLVGAFFTWFSSRGWIHWTPLFGSAVLAAYFVPAIIDTLRAYFKGEVVGGIQLANRLFVVALVLASLGVSVVSKLQARK
jgi:hypothetical protein